MLTTEDVCDWAVHSLHLPLEVRDLLWQNAVTGFDFPDLVEHDGQLIISELGIYLYYAYSKWSVGNKIHQWLINI